jgi:AcrR family transcriptional regulator
MTLYRQFGNKDNLVAAALEQWSTSWLHRLADAMDRRGDDPSDRFDGLWDELQAWFAEEPFRGSFVANAATELRSEPHHPAQTRIAQHRRPSASCSRTWPSPPAPTTPPSSPPSSRS